MKRKLLSALLLMAFILSALTACGGGTGNTPDDTTAPDDTTVNEDPPREMLTLIADGTSDYVIVRGENAYISEVTASTELQSYLKQITGVEVPIVTDAATPTEKEIVIGKTNRETEGEFDREELGEDGLVIKTVGKKLFIVGGEQRGTLFSVYEFLESYLGCRFYTKDFEKVPETDTVAIEVMDEEDKQIPVFQLRYISSYNYKNDIVTVKRKLSSRYSLPEEYGGYQAWIKWSHSYDDLVPPKTYYKDHPEYYSMGLTNAEIKENSSYEIGQLCLTNPEVLEIAIESARNLINKKKDDPNYRYFSISQNDNQDYCSCKSCKELYTKEGSHAAATVMFVNAIATALKDEFPHITFETLAYQYTRNVPLTVKPADNVIIRLCTIEECFSHPITEHPDNLNTSQAVTKTSFTQDIEQWSEITDNLFIWDYIINWSEFHASYPNFDVLLANARFFADSGVIGVHEESTSGSQCTSFHDLRLYVLSKVLWDPYMTEEEYYGLIDEFLRDVYGKGWTYLREYFDLMHEESADNCFGTFTSAARIFGFDDFIQKNEPWAYPEDLTTDMVRNYESVDWTQYWNFFTDVAELPQVVVKGYELFQKAYEAAETDQQRAAIDMESLQVMCVESSYLDRKFEGGENVIKRMINNFLKAHSSEFTIQERAKYSSAIADLAEEQMIANGCIELNTKLYEKFLEHGIVNTALDKTKLKDEKIEDLELHRRPSYW